MAFNDYKATTGDEKIKHDRKRKILMLTSYLKQNK
jgi:hypothetical protein